MSPQLVRAKYGVSPLNRSVAGHRLKFFAEWIARCFALMGLVGGIATLVGWWLDIPRLTDWFDHDVSMMANPAACTAVLGACNMIPTKNLSDFWRYVGVLLSLAVALTGALTCAEYAAGWNLGVDTLIFDKSWGQNLTTAPMRMGPPAAFSFLILGTASCCRFFGPICQNIASLLPYVSLIISFLSLAGFLFDARQLYAVKGVTSIALQTSVLIACLSICQVLLMHECGALKLLVRNDAGGLLFRILVIPILCVPVALSLLGVSGERLQIFDSANATALVVLLQTIFFFLLLYWSAESVSRYSSAANYAANKLASIVNSSSDAIVGHSLDGTIESWNQGAEEMFQYTAAEALGRHISILIPADHRQEGDYFLKTVLNGGRLNHFESVRLRKDGSVRNVSIALSPIYDGNGDIARISQILRDVTEKHYAEEVTRRSERELRSFADAIPHLAWIAEPSGDIIWMSQGWKKYTGADFDSLKGQGWLGTVPTENKDDVLASWNCNIRQNHSFEMELPLRRVDGEVRWFLARANPALDDSGNVTRWFGTITDVHEVKRAEAETEEQKRKLMLLNDIGVSLTSTLAIDELAHLVTCRAVELTGAECASFTRFDDFSRNDDVPLPLTTIGSLATWLDDQGTTLYRDVVRRMRSTKRLLRIDDAFLEQPALQTEREGGEQQSRKVMRSILAAPITSRSNEMIGALFFGHTRACAFNEQSERIIVGLASQASVAIENALLYQNLRQAAEERATLLEAERAARLEVERIGLIKDEFLATLSHELRTPLNAILGWAQILSLEDATDDDVKQGVDVIDRNARAQNQLISELLDMSRIAAGKIRLDVQIVQLASLMDAAIDSIRPAAEAKHITIHKHVDRLAGNFLGDPIRLQQIIWNLLTNAIKFTHKGGKVDLQIRRKDSNVEIIVKDNGVGIQPDVLPIIFDRFRQGDSTTKRQFSGLGLGLTIVKTLVELHGGSVRAESDGENLGATFTVHLPIAPLQIEEYGPGRPTQFSETSPFNIVDLTGVRILVVDDEIDARDLISKMLLKTNANVATAGSVDEALRSLSAAKPDVLVSDIGMPFVDGYQFIQRVRALSPNEGGEIPAIALTAFAQEKDRARALKAGYQFHLAKPVHPEELFSAIESALGRAGAPSNGA